MDIKTQIEHWLSTAEEDFVAARSLLRKRLFRHALFFAHLAIEKILKAHITNVTKAVPPKIHNLLRLAQLAALELSEEQAVFLRQFDAFQLEGRYPDYPLAPMDLKTARQHLKQAEETAQWLKSLL